MLRLGSGDWERGRNVVEYVRIILSCSPLHVQTEGRRLPAQSPLAECLDPEITSSGEWHEEVLKIVKIANTEL